MNPDKETLPTYEELRALIEQTYEQQALIVYYELMKRLMRRS